MRNGFDSSRYNSRSDMKNNKRKINRIYNILLGIVILLIFIVGGSIFLGGSKEEAAREDNKENTKTESEINDNEEETATSVEEEAEETDSNETDSNDTDSETEETSTEVVTEEETDLSTDPNAKVEVPGSGDNVRTAYTNESWQPVGTTQSGEHSADFTKDGTDWNEMEKAIMYGAGLTEGSYTLWWLQKGENPTSQAIGTIAPKDNSVTYRVYIDWIDGQGWKPTKVEELIVNDKK